jgi:tRNA (guanine37-N1)-methyltransferase
MRVPEVLLSGHHEKIRQWRLLMSIEKTRKHRPELLASGGLPPEARELLGQFGEQGDENGHDQGD